MKNIQVNLSEDEALVLFDWLANLSENSNLQFDHESEQRVVNDLEAILEKQLDVILSQDYNLALITARESIIKANS